MEYKLLDDNQLISMVAERDKEALSELYDRYVRPVYSLAYKITGDRSLSEEITQDVFLSLWQKADTFRPSLGRAGTWLLSIAHHKSVDYKKRVAYRTPKVSLDDGYGDLPMQSDVDTDPETHLWQRENRRIIVEALERLPESQRQAILLAYFGGLTHTDIAQRLATPLGTVKTRIRLGMFKLREILAKEREGDSIE